MPSDELSDAGESPLCRARILLAAAVLSLLGNVYLVIRCNQLEERMVANSAAITEKIRNLVPYARDARPVELPQGQRMAAEPQALPDVQQQIARAEPR
jgi:hypothetical protein